ncbi:MAG: type II toxin-antitoxin system YafQ family toxin [Bacteroidales bacterium]|nr:type II toxin-antitoxin system YafQ family toxin [Bacteroidales bacterium]
MTFEVKATGQFKKDYKVMQKRGAKIELLHDIIALLQQGVPLRERYRDHPLSGTYTGHRECHIKPDWLLVYYIEKHILVLTLTRTGTHSDLF